MNNLLKENVEHFDLPSDSEYFCTKEHQVRADLSIHLIGQVFEQNDNLPIKLLSIACSDGIIEEKIKMKFGMEVHGIDAARKSLERAKSRGIVIKYGDISESLPYPTGYFNFIFAGEIFEHILNIRSLFVEINRVLKTNGYLIVTTPNLAQIDDRIKFIFGKSPRQISPLHPYLYLHIRPFTFGSLKLALSSHGFSDFVLHTPLFKVDLFGKKISIYSRLLCRMFPTFGSNLVLRSRKVKSI